MGVWKHEGMGSGGMRVWGYGGMGVWKHEGMGSGGMRV